jgi:hypothetical protein
MSKSRSVFLALLFPLACQGFQDGWPSEHAQYEFNPSPGVEYEVCVPTQFPEIHSVDLDIGDYLRALDESVGKTMPQGDIKLRRYLPKMSPPGHVTVRYTDGTAPVYGFLGKMSQYEGGVRSRGAGRVELRDVTESGQAVFYADGLRFRDLVAISIGLPDTASGQPVDPHAAMNEYWFLVPPEKKVPSNEFGPWLAPTAAGPGFSVESPIRWKGNQAGHGQLIAGDTGPMPKIRFRLVDIQEIGKIDDAWYGLAPWIPGLIDKQYGVTTSKGNLSQLIRPADPIPDCN